MSCWSSWAGWGAAADVAEAAEEEGQGTVVAVLALSAGVRATAQSRAARPRSR